MFLKTKAIVLHCLKYSAKASIVHLITEERGRIACVVYGVARKRSGMKMAFLQPMSLVEMELEMQPDRELHRIIEAKPTVIVSSLHTDPVKSALALIIAEVLYRTLRETQTDRTLYRFLEESILILEHSELSCANFHLVMMLQMTRFFGFYPNLESDERGSYFDMENGVFTTLRPPHRNFLPQSESVAFRQLMRMNYVNMHKFAFSRGERVAILEHIIAYYRIHLAEFGEIKSLPVLIELFD